MARSHSRCSPMMLRGFNIYTYAVCIHKYIYVCVCVYTGWMKLGHTGHLAQGSLSLLLLLLLRRFTLPLSLSAARLSSASPRSDCCTLTCRLGPDLRAQLSLARSSSSCPDGCDGPHFHRSARVCRHTRLYNDNSLTYTHGARSK